MHYTYIAITVKDLFLRGWVLTAQFVTHYMTAGVTCHLLAVFQAVMCHYSVCVMFCIVHITHVYLFSLYHAYNDCWSLYTSPLGKETHHMYSMSSYSSLVVSTYMCTYIIQTYYMLHSIPWHCRHGWSSCPLAWWPWAWESTCFQTDIHWARCCCYVCQPSLQAARQPTLHNRPCEFVFTFHILHTYMCTHCTYVCMYILIYIMRIRMYVYACICIYSEV